MPWHGALWHGMAWHGTALAHTGPQHVRQTRQTVWPAPDDARARKRRERESVAVSPRNDARSVAPRAQIETHSCGSGCDGAAARACDTNTHAAQTGRTQTPNRRKTAMAVCAREGASSSSRRGVCGDTHTARTRGWQDERALMCARGPWRSAARARSLGSLGSGGSRGCARPCAAAAPQCCSLVRVRTGSSGGGAAVTPRPRAPRPLVQAGRGGRARVQGARRIARARWRRRAARARACGARGSARSPFSVSLSLSRARSGGGAKKRRPPAAACARGGRQCSIISR
jgi:hypothetical protein